jgi:hypothetical protein
MQEKCNVKNNEGRQRFLSLSKETQSNRECDVWRDPAIINTGWVTAGIGLLTGVLGIELEWMSVYWVPMGCDYVWCLICGLLVMGSVVAIACLTRFPRSHSTMFTSFISSLLLILADVCLIIIDYTYPYSSSFLFSIPFSPAPVWFQGSRTGILLLPLAMWALRTGRCEHEANAKPAVVAPLEQAPQLWRVVR